jgi:chromosome segregation ATPase
MESFGVGIAGLGAAGVATLGAFGLAFRKHRRRREKTADVRVAQVPTHRPRTEAERLEALAAAQANLALRLDELASQGGAPEERLQAMAGQLLGLVRDKNATLETALAGLDQLRARMRALEQMGEPAEARALLETLQGRIDEVQAAQAAGTAALEARLEALAAPGADNASALAERLVKHQESRDQGSDAVIARLGQLETRFGALEAGREALKRLEGRIEALQAEGAAAKTEIAGLKAETGGPVKDLAEQLARLHAQKEALAGQLVARIGALETELRGRDPQPVLDRLAERLEALRAADAAIGDRLAALETPAETPYAAIAAQLTERYPQKDAGLEAMLGRLAPLEGKIGDLADAIRAARASDPDLVREWGRAFRREPHVARIASVIDEAVGRA